MDKRTLYNEVIKSIEMEDYKAVVDLWKKGNRKILDFNDDEDKDMCDAVSCSYLNLDQHKEALFYIDERVASMKTISGKNDRIQNDYSNWNFYYSMKARILLERKTFFSMYKFTLEYKKFGGSNVEYLSTLDMIESLYYDRVALL